jgi:hypothetical protein
MPPQPRNRPLKPCLNGTLDGHLAAAGGFAEGPGWLYTGSACWGVAKW